MPYLMLLRHAEAVPHSPTDDFSRVLSAKGRRDAARLGAYMQAERIFPSLVIASPAARTRQTSELVLAAIQPAPPLIFDESLYNSSAAALLRVAARIGAPVEALLIVGHNPGIEELAQALAKNDKALKALLKSGLPTCTLAVFETATALAASKPGNFRLVRLRTPDTLIV
jgi:phosphohistidine phosphatase